jgi:hypothetical protein
VTDEPDEPMMRPDGHRYEAPEDPEETEAKGWDMAILGIVVFIIMVLIATGAVQIFDI